ncbi:MAG: undecaprenyl-diphosphate phosphatase [Bacillota bacterium]
MSYWEAVLLGLVQGLTEFLPVSSSGHLVIFSSLIDFQSQGVVFEVLVHFGTLIAILIVFRKDILDLMKNPFQKLTILILVGSIPTAIIGFAFEDAFERMFSSLSIVGFTLLITGAILWIAEIKRNNIKSIKDMNFLDAIFVGLAQGAAITPGISRSGTTIAMALILGIDRKTAARYSFLLSIPVIMGVTVLKIKQLLGQSMAADLYGPYIVGSIVAAVSGYFAIKILLKFLAEGKLRYFSVYCWMVGITVVLITYL